MQSRILFSLCLLLLVSCEKDLNIKLNETHPKLVVDASIENDLPPRVVLSTSLDYFGEITPELLINSFVHHARITIRDDTHTHVLVEDSIPLVNGIFFYFYSNNSLDPATAIYGKLNTKYDMTIETGGQIYTSTTTIPWITRRIDSLWWETAPPPTDTSKVRMMITATDKPGFGDYIRYFTKTNSEPFYPGFNSAFDDQVIDGKTYTVPVDRGVNKNAVLKDDDVFFKRGDTATLKLCNIDRNTFEFWRTFEFNFQSIGNPFSSPTKVIGNISNGALGYFGGYAAQFRTIFIPR